MFKSFTIGALEVPRGLGSGRKPSEKSLTQMDTELKTSSFKNAFFTVTYTLRRQVAIERGGGRCALPAMMSAVRGGDGGGCSTAHQQHD
jgi:hypothetical protein